MFKDLLQTSREEAQKIVSELAQKIIDTTVVEEKLEIINDSFKEDIDTTTQIIKQTISIKQQLIIELKKAYNLRKKLYHKDKYSKHCYRLLNENRLSLKDFEFCFKNIIGLNALSLDYKLLGGGTMLELEKLIKSGLSLDQALNQKIEIKD
jgi:hypothetical protein